MSCDCPREAEVEAASGAEAGPGRRRWLRLAILAVVLLGLLALGRALGAGEYLTVERIEQTTARAGLWAVPVFWTVFALGELVHVPGIVFVAGACASYGWLAAFLVAFSGALVSATFSFYVVRLVAGRALQGIRNRFLRRILDQVDRRPLRTVIVLRLILWMAPQLNYALALTGIRYRDYLAGTVVGLVPPVLGMVVFFEWLLNRDIGAVFSAAWPWLLGCLLLAAAAGLLWALRRRAARGTGG